MTDDGEGVPLAQALDEAFGAMATSAPAGLPGLLSGLSAAASEVLAERGGRGSARDLLTAAAARLTDSITLPEAEAASIGDALSKLVSGLPAGELTALDPATPLTLVVAALRTGAPPATGRPTPARCAASASSWRTGC